MRELRSKMRIFMQRGLLHNLLAIDDADAFGVVDALAKHVVGDACGSWSDLNAFDAYDILRSSGSAEATTQVGNTEFIGAFLFSSYPRTS